MLKPSEFDQYLLKNDDGMPLRMYRGFHSNDVETHVKQPFITSANRALPTFTTSPDIAQLYARKPNNRNHMTEDSLGVVGIYEIAMKNPVDLNSKEDIVDYYIMEELLGDKMQTQQWQAFWQWSLDNCLWIQDGETLNADDIAALSEEKHRTMYIDTYHVCDNEGLFTLFKELGYDGYIYRGTTPVWEEDFERTFEEAAQDGSFDNVGRNCAEFRPFYQTQVRHALSQEPIEYYRPAVEPELQRAM